MTVITRFAPSPTGYLHIGSCRTALFNYLFARHHGGKFLLRIEDTDKARSTKDAINAILEGMEWLNLKHDGEIIFQSSREERHREAAYELIKMGKAYFCYASKEEMEELYRTEDGKRTDQKIISPWRDKDESQAPKNIKPVIRLKTPLEGETIIHDLVQGTVKIQNATLDDMVLLRSDGSPTYMHAVVVDDHDMGITHVIRGDDHLTNAFRQYKLYEAFGWDIPHFAHIPLIHGSDGAKLSKRHGALGVDAYHNMGILPEAMCNYLLRLGWSHGDAEIISREEAIKWFNIESIGKSPSRLDFAKLEHVNSHYINNCHINRLVQITIPFIIQKFNLDKLEDHEIERLKLGFQSLKTRAKTLIELAQSAQIYLDYREDLVIDDKIIQLLKENKNLVIDMLNIFTNISDWQTHAIDNTIKTEIEKHGNGFAYIGKPFRACITGMLGGPSLPEIISILGKKETLKRINFILGKINNG